MAEIDTRPSAPGASNGEWGERGIGTAGQHRFFYWVLRLGGKTRAYHIGWFAALWYVLFYPSIRRRCRHYLDRRFPERRGAVRRFGDTYRLVRTYSGTLVDMMALGVLGPGSLAAASPDRERLLEIAGRPGGFVLVHAHVGCWQVGMSTLGHLGKKVNIVMIPEARTAGLFDGAKAGVIDPRTGLEGVMRMTEALLGGEVVTMMGDRTFGEGQNTVTVEFLGGKIALPVTPYRLASATGSPVVVMTAPKIDGRSYAVRLSRVIEVPAGLGREARAYAPYAREFAGCLEEFVREYPWQFYNFYDLWGGERVEG